MIAAPSKYKTRCGVVATIVEAQGPLVKGFYLRAVDNKTTPVPTNWLKDSGRHVYEVGLDLIELITSDRYDKYSK